MGRNYGLIIFDIDGTFYKFKDRIENGGRIILPIRQEVLSRGIGFISRRLGVSEQEAARISQDNIALYGSVGAGLERRFGVNIQEYFFAAWNVDPSKYMDPDPEMRGLISGIQQKKAVLTSSPSIWAGNVLGFFEIDDLFNGYWFGDHGTKKPNRVAYTQVLDGLQTPAERTVFVDDELANLRPAKELGMTTVLVGDCVDPSVDYNVESVHEVPRLIKGL